MPARAAFALYIGLVMWAGVDAWQYRFGQESLFRRLMEIKLGEIVFSKIKIDSCNVNIVLLNICI